MKIEIKCIYGSILFEYDCENNSIRKTLEQAIKSSANLSSANLSFADLSSANLRSANLSSANLRFADFNEGTCFLSLSCPEEGSFIAFKKAAGKIIKLQVTEDSKRSSATTLKCRGSKIKTLQIQNLDGSDSGLNEVLSDYDNKTKYIVGEITEVDNFDEDRWNECSTGIHFFITRELAVKY